MPPNFCNARSQWLGDVPSVLDATVVAVYGWLADISDDDALRESPALNGTEEP